MLTRNGMGIWNLKVHTQWHTSNNASPLNFQKVSLGDYSHSSTATLAASLLKTTWLAVKKENIDLLTSLFHSAVNLYSPRNHSEICIVFDFFFTYTYSSEFFTSNFVYLTFIEGHHHELANFRELRLPCFYWACISSVKSLTGIVFKTPISFQHCLQCSSVSECSEGWNAIYFW